MNRSRCIWENRYTGQRRWQNQDGKLVSGSLTKTGRTEEVGWSTDDLAVPLVTDHGTAMNRYLVLRATATFIARSPLLWGAFPHPPPYALALLTPAALCCSNIQLCPFNLESSPKLTTMISKQFPSPLHTMHGYVDNVCDCCKNDGVKIGSPTKKKKEIKTYLNKLKQFRPNLRLPRLEPNIEAMSLWPP